MVATGWEACWRCGLHSVSTPRVCNISTPRVWEYYERKREINTFDCCWKEDNRLCFRPTENSMLWCLENIWEVSLLPNSSSFLSLGCLCSTPIKLYSTFKTSLTFSSLIFLARFSLFPIPFDNFVYVLFKLITSQCLTL